MTKSRQLVQQFKDCAFYKEAQEAAAILQKHQSQIRDSLRVVTYDEILLVRLEIDLNFLDIDEALLAILELNFDEPLTINLSINEHVCKHALILIETRKQRRRSILNAGKHPAQPVLVRVLTGRKDAPLRLQGVYAAYLREIYEDNPRAAKDGYTEALSRTLQREF